MPVAYRNGTAMIIRIVPIRTPMLRIARINHNTLRAHRMLSPVEHRTLKHVASASAFVLEPDQVQPVSQLRALQPALGSVHGEASGPPQKDVGASSCVPTLNPVAPASLSLPPVGFRLTVIAEHPIYLLLVVMR
jgi:hypothetical protein